MDQQNNSAHRDGRRTNFEIVAKPNLPPDGPFPPRRILSVSFDPSLARTRDMLFSASGFQVATYTDADSAVQACRRQSFDLIVIGHSIPLTERRDLLSQIHGICDAPVLSLFRHGEPSLPGADYAFDASQSPAQLVEIVTRILSDREWT
jgi:DNA-binding NtrC family response regulator